jgi:hypothetical protein
VCCAAVARIATARSLFAARIPATSLRGISLGFIFKECRMSLVLIKLLSVSNLFKAVLCPARDLAASPVARMRWMNFEKYEARWACSGVTFSEVEDSGVAPVEESFQAGAVPASQQFICGLGEDHEQRKQGVQPELAPPDPAAFSAGAPQLEFQPWARTVDASFNNCADWMEELDAALGGDGHFAIS